MMFWPHRKGNANIWSRGQWQEHEGLATVGKDGSGWHAQCDAVVFERGIIERRVEIRTSEPRPVGQAGVLSSRLTPLNPA
jgi:hypothetical protein